MLHTLSGIKAVIRGMEGRQVTELWLSWKVWGEVKIFEAALSTFCFPFMINLYLAEIRFENCSAVRRECVCNGRCYCYDSCTKHLVPFTTLCSYDCIVVLELLCTALIYVYAVCAFFQSKICINGSCLCACSCSAFQYSRLSASFRCCWTNIITLLVDSTLFVTVVRVDCM